jgi:hypothetical protein
VCQAPALAETQFLVDAAALPERSGRIVWAMELFARLDQRDYMSHPSRAAEAARL